VPRCPAAFGSGSRHNRLNTSLPQTFPGGSGKDQWVASSVNDPPDPYSSVDYPGCPQLLANHALDRVSLFESLSVAILDEWNLETGTGLVRRGNAEGRVHARIGN
jgi:hypothetical protein